MQDVNRDWFSISYRKYTKKKFTIIILLHLLIVSALICVNCFIYL